MKLFIKHKDRLRLVTVFVILVGVGVTVALIQSGSLDIRSLAFRGVQILPGLSNIVETEKVLTQTDAIGGEGVGNDPSPLTSIPEEDNIRSLYHALTRTYPNPSTINFSEPSLGVFGTASYFYDAPIDKTLIFMRLENMPYMEFSPLTAWYSDVEGFDLAGYLEYHFELELPVAYAAFSADGDITGEYEAMVLSYDPPKSTEPLLPVVTLLF